VQPDDRTPLNPRADNPQPPGAAVFDADAFDEDFQDLIEQSSLGTPGACTLRQRAPAADLTAVQRIARTS
jgi:hypothetical protein